MAYLEFRNGRKWKRTEYAAQYMEKLFSDPKIEACCTFLDWKARKMRVPEAYSVFTKKTSFTHTWEKMAVAINSPLESPEDPQEAEESRQETPCNFQWQQVLYRDYFDRFFEFLAHCDRGLKSDLLQIQDVEHLHYWTCRIMEDQGEAFKPFIDKYGYTGVKSLHSALRSYKSRPVRHWMMFRKTP